MRQDLEQLLERLDLDIDKYTIRLNISIDEEERQREEVALLYKELQAQELILQHMRKSPQAVSLPFYCAIKEQIDDLQEQLLFCSSRQEGSRSVMSLRSILQDLHQQRREIQAALDRFGQVIQLHEWRTERER
jgi:hypothetical protein